MFNKINDTQFSFNGETFTVADGVTIEKATGVISLDKFDEATGLVNTAFDVYDFKRFISDSYNGDENIKDWLKYSYNGDENIKDWLKYSYNGDENIKDWLKYSYNGDENIKDWLK